MTTHDSHDKASLECAGTGTETTEGVKSNIRQVCCLKLSPQQKHKHPQSLGLFELMKPHRDFLHPPTMSGLHIPDDYKNSAKTFIIMIASHPAEKT